MTVDLPGHGSTPGDPRETVGGYARWLRDLLAARKLGEVNLVGHSMGGAIVIEFALTYSEMTRSIALVATGAKLRVSPVILDGLRDRTKDILRTIVDWSFSGSTERALREDFLAILRGTPLQVSEMDYMACDNFDRMTSIEQIGVPCLVVCGEEDRMTPPKYSQYLAKNIKGAVLSIVPAAGHMVMMEQPHKFNQTLETFLLGLSGAL